MRLNLSREMMIDRGCAEEISSLMSAGDFGVSVARARRRDFFLDITFY
jgi:hypothetical protein